MTAPDALTALVSRLEGLMAKATDSDLSDGGRYFAETCDDLTQCRHQEVGEYQHAPDGELVELLWNHRALIRDALSRLSATDNRAPVEDGWRDIESAPKDGTYILIAVPNHDGGMTTAKFDAGWYDGEGWWLLDDGKNFEIPLRGEGPTRWMPLPAAPTPPGSRETEA